MGYVDGIMVYVHEEFDQLAWSENASYIYPGDLWMAIFTGIGAKRPIELPARHFSTMISI